MLTKRLILGLFLLGWLTACNSAESARPSDSQIDQSLKSYIETGIEKQWKVKNIVTVTNLDIIQTSTSGRICHVRVKGTILFNQTLGARNLMGFGGGKADRKQFRSRMNFLRQNGQWKLQSLKIEEHIS